MSRVCFLTDDLVQFTRQHFPGQEHVYQVLPGVCQPVGTNPHQPLKPVRERTEALTAGDFLRAFRNLSGDYHHILAVLSSPALSDSVGLAEQAARTAGNARVEVIDSRTTAVGLGLILQAGAEAVSAGRDQVELEHLLRISVRHVYTLFCIPGLRYLARTGRLSQGQAFVGEVMGLLPLFTIDDGRLTPIQKVRTHRHLIESFQEYLDEFIDPLQIALLRGGDNRYLRARPIRDYVVERFPGTIFNEYPLLPGMTGLLGPQSIAMLVLERTAA